ncbi:MAG: calcium/sodium antiporter [Lachnospiraceae bacterium]|nr:calcium/sodium antiporter [Lachnospiraceae bacterium]
MKLLLAILLLVIGFVMLIKGADWFVDGAAGIAARFGIPQLVIGLTIVAMGTSAPEAAVSITAATSGNAGITIGNIVGSNILNVLLILGLTAVITTVAVQKSTVKLEMPFMHVITIVLAVLGFTGGEIVLWEGVVLWVLFLVYLGYLFRMAKNGTDEEEEEELQPLWKQLLMLVVGIVLIVFGSDLTVDNATVIAETLGMDDRLIGLTIVAFGTSLPELVTSVTAARKGKADIAIGNIVGSNVFNILFVVGTTALITPVAFKMGFLIDLAVALAAGLILWFGVMKDQKLKRPVGIVMLAVYAAYFVYLLMG